MHAVVFANKPVAEHANKDCSWFSMDATFKIVPKEARLLSPRGSQVCYVSIINDQITLALLLTKTLMITNFPGSQHFGRLPGNSRHSLHDRHDRQESRSLQKSVRPDQAALPRFQPKTNDDGLRRQPQKDIHIKISHGSALWLSVR